MGNQDLIIYLIQQDLRQIQLLRLLEKGGTDIENFYLDIMTIVGQLMGLPEKEISDQFSLVYNSFMEESVKYEITGTGNHLSILAGQCYHLLKNCIEIEKRSNDYCNS